MEKPNFFWGSNLKYLRNRKKLSQEDLAERVGITRVKLNSHEQGTSKNPPLEDLIKFSEFFKISIDSLIKVNISKLHELKLRELEAGNDVYVSGNKIRVLAISVDKKNNENITYVPVKAKAGYSSGYSDPAYIETLPSFNLPHLSEKKTYRMFPTEGKSMLPIPENSLILTEYVADWTTLKNTPCIVILRNEQDFVFKNVTFLSKENTLQLHSLNPEYADRNIFVGDVLEIWSYNSHLTDVLPSSTIIEEVLRIVNEIKVDVKSIASV